MRKFLHLRHFSILSFFLFLAAPTGNVWAQNEGFAVEVASDHVDITVGFVGSSIELFGDRRDKDAQIALVVEGPRKDMTIWKKERVLGAWMNRYFVKYMNMPSYYQYAASGESDDEDYQKALLENGIGIDAMFASLETEKSRSIKDLEDFSKSFLEKKKALGAYFEEPALINFINDNFFRVSFSIPPSAPTGDYTIHSYLIKNGKVVRHYEKTLKVEQVGVNAFVSKSAQDYSFIYAMVCIVFALTSGWLISVLRVRP